MLLEIRTSKQYAEAYLTSTVKEEREFWAPAYRAPVEFAERALAHLQAEGLLTPDQLQQCQRWLLSAREFNRCLEYAADVAGRLGDDKARFFGQKETDRLKIKSENVQRHSEEAAKVAGKILRSWRVRRFLSRSENHSA